MTPPGQSHAHGKRNALWIDIDETYDKHRKANKKYRKRYKDKYSFNQSHPLHSESTNLSRPDDTRTDQFINLIPDDGVLHVILERCRVGLSLLQDRLHDWITHNLLYEKIVDQS
jgi:hypothetical protein